MDLDNHLTYQAFCTESMTREPDTGASQSHGINDFFKQSFTFQPVIWKLLTDFM
ncbi:hypothetical protein LNO81_30745 [Klebsiella variicola subsp. variicola]|nr:hypothetical protein [Klebsiella variicola subsp. variicola]SXF65018.1 Uncharacterised protein [Klebsiella variicola]